MIFLATIYNLIVVSLAVLLHYQFLSLMSKRLILLKIKPQLRVLYCVFGILAVHSAQVWIFALAYYITTLPYWGGAFGNIIHTSGVPVQSLLDFVYFSFTSFSTLGYGDITAEGLIRFLTGIEALTGFVLITWSASFLIFEMNSNWESEKKTSNPPP